MVRYIPVRTQEASIRAACLSFHFVNEFCHFPPLLRSRNLTLRVSLPRELLQISREQITKISLELPPDIIVNVLTNVGTQRRQCQRKNLEFKQGFNDRFGKMGFEVVLDQKDAREGFALVDEVLFDFGDDRLDHTFNKFQLNFRPPKRSLEM